MCLPDDTRAAIEEVHGADSAPQLTMPPSFYRDPAVFATERERVMFAGWLCVGRADEIPEPGDYITIEILDEPLIVTRQKDSSIRVLSNVCRHRGSRIVEDRGHTSRFTCPYHRWSYTIDGALKSAPLVEDQPHFDKRRCHLPSFPVTEWMGWLFTNLDSSAAPLDSVLGGLDAYVANYHAEEMRTVDVAIEFWDTNWKCLAENFMEGYHLTPVHRKTLHPMTPTRLCEKIVAGTGYTGYKSHYTTTFTGRTESHPDMNDEEKSQSMMVWIFPAFVAAISPNSAVYMSITPEGPERLKTRWGVIARQGIFDSGEARERFAFASAFNAEDRARLLDVQKGLRSRYAERGCLAPPDLEGTVGDFYRFMAEKLLQATAADTRYEPATI